jgi:hypothetical protein
MLRHLMLGLMLAAGFVLFTPAPKAQASDSGWWYSSNDGQTSFWDSYHYYSGGHCVPELDPTATGSALVLILGGVAYITSRRREEEDAV